ncbi:MAG: hypothetical protein AAGA21_00065 [Pseudomonadota bacterium]
MLSKAILSVRAVVPEADREAFDIWYRDEHLRDAVVAFGADRAWRGWSTVDPGVHVAFYEFSDPSSATTILDSEALKGLVAEFDRVWQERVPRSREVVHCIDECTPES